MSSRSVRWRVWFHRTRAVAWAVVGILSFPLGLADSIVLVWIASMYANVASDWSASEAADDRKMIERLERVEVKVDRLEEKLDQLLELTRDVR